MRAIFEGQLVHLLVLLLLLAGLALVADSVDGFWDGALLGLSTHTWFMATVANAIVHQLYVWLWWRLALHTDLPGRAFGDAAFRIYAVGFALLIIARPCLATGVAVANAGTLLIDRHLALTIAALLAIPTVYLAWSLKRYFGFMRAFGLDHFDPEARSWPLVREGIFAYTPNAMYVFGFLTLWILAIAFRSKAALAVAAFSHLYIWVHYFCTERPDIRRIYGS